MSDFYWTKDGFFYKIIPNNPQSEEIWKTIDATFKGCAIPMSAWPGLVSQLKDAGYTVRKARKLKPLTEKELDAMLKELGV